LTRFQYVQQNKSACVFPCYAPVRCPRMEVQTVTFRCCCETSHGLLACGCGCKAVTSTAVLSGGLAALISYILVTSDRYVVLCICSTYPFLTVPMPIVGPTLRPTYGVLGGGFPPPPPRLNRPKSAADHPILYSAVAENALAILCSWREDRLSLQFFVVFSPHSQMLG